MSTLQVRNLKCKCYTELMRRRRRLTKKDKQSLLKVIAGICGNLSAGWFGFILITPGLEQFKNADAWIALTRSLVFGIVFMLIAFRFERQSA